MDHTFIQDKNSNQETSLGHISSLTQTNPTKSNAVQIPKVELPKGGGAIKGIAEKFEVNAANGTASFSIPIPLSPGRNGSAPELALSYNSGGGNSIFGLGWGVGIPSIQRKTEKELPQYKDDEDSDTFIFSGAEDLVPVLKEENGAWVKDKLTENNRTVTKYRPRIEGLFSRIEYIQEGENKYWKVTSRDNMVSVYGKTENARIQNPEDTTQIFRWNLEYSYDDKGHFTRYVYKHEDGSEIPELVSEKNRIANQAKYTNSYLKEVLYGNKKAYYPDQTIPEKVTDFLFRLVFDYGEHHIAKPLPTEEKHWNTRVDPYSSYRSGFEIRTYRLCQRVLMFHQIDELSLTPYLVRSLDFEYNPNLNFTYLDRIVQKGYIWTKDGNLKEEMSLPPIEFSYAKNPFHKEVEFITKENLHAAPSGLAGNAQWVDLFSEGLSGMLAENDSAWYYKHNLGNGEFSEPTLVAPKPSYAGIQNGALSLQELEGNGTKQLVQTGKNGGYFELSPCEGWKPFQTFDSFPNIDLNDPNLKYIDLNGDGLPELVLSNDAEFLWYPNKGKKGYDNYQVAPKTKDEELGPKILFSDQHDALIIATADMIGDGLSDIVLIQNNSVCYYPNLGYGRFGARVQMPMKGSFDHSDQFNPSYIHLADMDGSGTTDIVYTGKNNIQIRYNHSGNSLSEADEFFNPFPRIDNQSKISVIDLLGTGTSCIVWSSALPGDKEAPLRYIDTTKGKKPHIMTSYKNNMGKEVHLQYQPSTKYYVDDKKAGNPWITKLPFPIHCVDRVELIDHVSETRFTNTYTYHHGYYDGVEREFRGFAMVEQKDTEEFTNFKVYENGTNIEVIPEDVFQAPVITKSWFHTGYYACKEKHLHQLQKEYYGVETESDFSFYIADFPLPVDIEANELSEAYRALKGLPLRQEIYSTEGDEALHHISYTIAHYNYQLQKLQSKAKQKHAVFLTTEKENISFHLERNPDDPRIQHQINTKIDAFGNIHESAAIVYGRQQEDDQLPSDKDRIQQATQHIIYTQNRFTKAIDTNTAYRLPLPCATQSFELKSKPSEQSFYQSKEIDTAFANATQRNYDEAIVHGEKRCIEHSKILYLKNDLSSAMPFGKMDTRALSYQNYVLAFTPEMLTNRYGTRVEESLLRNQGHYVRFEGDDNYWIRSGVSHFHPVTNTPEEIIMVSPPTTQDLENAKANFFMPTVFEDPLGNLTKLNYGTHQLFIEKSVDALQNTMTVVGFNYRTLSPYVLKDPNENRSAARFNALGLPTALFIMGKEGSNEGDVFSNASIEAHANDKPSVVMEYDFTQFMQDPTKANFVKTTAYEQHKQEQDTKTQITYAYADGSGNVVLEKTNAEAGKVSKYNVATGQKETKTVPKRWVGSGRTILNNKGNPIKQYEPFFDDNPDYTNEVDLVCQGYSPILYYDALGRLIKTENPDGTLTKVVFDAWKQEAWDENDTLLESDWYTKRIALANTNPQYKGAKASEVHANTPNTSYLDSLGRVFLTEQHNKWKHKINLENFEYEAKYHTRIEYDIESNPLKLIDARGNVVMQWQYDLLGHQVFENSMDAGKKYMLPDALQRPIRSWDSRQHMIAQSYDELNRPTSTKLYDKNGDTFVFERFIYGEDLANAEQQNLRGQLYQFYDKSGCVTSTYDFKGNPLSTIKQLVANYKNTPNWPETNPEMLLDVEIYTHKYTYDALNRPITQTTPDGSIQTQVYNEAGFLEELSLQHKGHVATKPVIRNIDYNAKGQKEAIRYGNYTKTSYDYDEKNYRLTHMRTTRHNPNTNGASVSLLKNNNILQDLYYTYDPVGNITRIYDDAILPVYNGTEILVQSDYTYDALYQLKTATGREHNQAIAHTEQDNWNDAWSKHGDLNNPYTIRKYTQVFDYDAVGNIMQLKHLANDGNYTRHYRYQTGNNQLLQTIVGQQKYNYSYNEQGSMINLPHLDVINWNFKEEVAGITRKDGLEVRYTYDAESQRSRRVIHNADGSTQEYRYLGAYETYTKKDAQGTIIEQSESLHIQAAEDDRTVLIENFSISQKIPINTPLYRYQCGNHLGSVNMELDNDGNIITYEEYHPYGTTALSATHATIKHFKKRYRYTGMERDDESGLNYHTARYYLPWLGRWLSTDPIGVGDGVNMFKYSNNNPNNGNDKIGLYCDSNIASCDTTNIEEVENASLDENERNTSANWVDVPQESRKPRESNKSSESRENVLLDPNMEVTIILTDFEHYEKTGVWRNYWTVVRQSEVEAYKNRERSRLSYLLGEVVSGTNGGTPLGSILSSTGDDSVEGLKSRINRGRLGNQVTDLAGVAAGRATYGESRAKDQRQNSFRKRPNRTNNSAPLRNPRATLAKPKITPKRKVESSKASQRAKRRAKKRKRQIRKRSSRRNR